MAMSRARRIVGNLLVALVGVSLAGSAIAKFMNVPAVAIPMSKLGFFGERLQVIAVLEIVSALLFVIPRTRSAGLLMASAYMGGAIAAHVGHGDPQFQPAAAILTLLWIAAAVRDPEAFWSFAYRRAAA